MSGHCWLVTGILSVSLKPSTAKDPAACSRTLLMSLYSGPTQLYGSLQLSMARNTLGVPQDSSDRDAHYAAEMHSAEHLTHIHEMAGSLCLRIVTRVLWDVLFQIILHILCQEVG